MSQKTDILAWLGTYGTLTNREAMLKLGVGRLASRVNELRDEGYPIEKIMVQEKKQDGRIVRYARYFMGRANEQV